MVGVRSSRGCKACRRKKRGCDLSQPTCGQCQRIGAKCTYETRPWTFVSQQKYAITPLQPPARISSSGISLLQTDRRQQLETTFFEAYLPSGESVHDTAFTHTVIATWIPTIRYLANQDQTTRLALDSCIFMALGQIQGNLDFSHRGMAMYCEALTQTNRALQHAATVQNDAALATCTLLAMCEKYRPHAGSEVSSQASDYQEHVKGTAKLLELRGSHKHVHEHGFALFAHARPSIALSGITRRQKAHVGSCLWLEVPWSAQHRQRTLKDKLVDATLSAAGALEQLDLCHNNLYKTIVVTTEFGAEHRPPEDVIAGGLDQCITTIEQLRTWEEEALLTHSSSTASTLSDICADHGFGFFHLVMQYWAVSLLLSARCMQFLSHLAKAIPSSTQVLAASVPSPLACAMNIATYAHHYFNPNTGLVGPQHASFPLGAALHFFAAIDRREAAGANEQCYNGAADSMHCPPISDIAAAKERIKSLFRTVKRAGPTAEFLRSMAADPAPKEIKGGVRVAGEHGKMAREWFKVGEKAV